ncbi:MAG: caspase family protein [Saprospiraceae bacterium]|nr:caspase family protein [Saprospiraceae bacterium]
MKKFFRILLLLHSSFIIYHSPLIAQAPTLVIPSGLKEIVGIHDVGISPDQKFVLAIAGRNVQVYDYNSGVMYKNLVLRESMSAVSFSPDSKWAYVSGDEEFAILDLQKIEVAKTIPISLSGLSHDRSADGKTVFFGYEGVQRYDVATGSIRVVKEYPAEWGTCNQLSASPDGKQVLAKLYEYKSNVERSVILDAFSGNVIKEFPKEKDVNYASFTPTGNVLKIAKKTVKGDYGDEEVYEVSWINSITMRQVGKTHTVQSADGFDDRFAFLPNSDDMWASIANGKQIQFLSPDKPMQVVQLQGVESKSKYGTWEATSLRLNRDASRLVIGSDDNQVIEVEVPSGNQTKSFGYQVFSPQFVSSGPNFKGLAMLDNDNTLMVLYSDNGRIRQRILGKGKTPAAFSHNGKYMAAGYEVWPTATFKDPISFDVMPDADLMHYAHGTAASFSNDDKLVAINGAENTIVASLPSGSVVATIPSRATKSFFSADGKTLYIYYKYPYSGKEENYMQAWDIASQTKRWDLQFRPAIFEGSFDHNNGKCLLYSVTDGVVYDINLANGSKRKLRDNMPTFGTAAALSHSGKYFADQGKVFDANTGVFLKNRPGDGYVNGHLFYANDKILVSPLGTNETQFADWQQSRAIGQLILLHEDDQWAFVAPDGRFDASPEMMKKLYYAKGTEIIPLDRLSERYYTPRLFASLLEEGNVPQPAQQDDDIKKLKSPPTVRIYYNNEKLRNLLIDDDSPSYVVENEQITLKVEGKCSDDAVSEIRLFHNGKLVDNATRNLTVEDDDEAGVLTKNFNLVLSPGDNIFQAIALNSQRTESEPDEVLITLKAAPKPTPTPSNGGGNGITLHLVVIGINNYKNPKYNLNYAQADALGFKEAIAKNCGKIVTSCKEHYVTDVQAVKAGIVAELNKVVAEARPQDVFVLYYAGHGVVSSPSSGGQGGEFYLVPQDVTQLYGNDGALAQKGLSASELKDFAQKIKAQKQLFILDACQSSGALETVAARGAAEEKAIAQLARSTGTHWLTAAGSEQFASEFSQLGHGVFTYALLQGLAGAADTGDGKITVKELDAYLQEQVPELTQKYKGTPQYPASFGFGQDFPVGIK